MLTKKDLHKLNECLYEVPKTYRSDMRVPARIYVDEKMLEDVFRDKSLEQLVNTTTLPGIVKYAMAMPDIHEGYGFPIGGVAATNFEGGVISPGGIGFDINCLMPETKILHKYGYRMKIKDFEKGWSQKTIKSMNLSHGPINTEILAFQKLKPQNKIYYLKTLSGQEIGATEDHPFYTPEGMTPLKNFQTSTIALYPFEGIDYQSPDDSIIVSEKDIEKISIRQNKRQVIQELIKRGLLPLRANNDKLPALLKLFGFILGDGTINFIGREQRGIIWFYGQPEDLEEIRADLTDSGYKPSKIYSRKRKHKINTLYRQVKFERVEYSFKTTSSSLVTLLLAMGLPKGNKASQDFILPEWLLGVVSWQKRLFLAALFGAELSAPQTMKGADYNFYEPILSLNKQARYLKSGEKFLRQIAQILKDLGVGARGQIAQRKEYYGKNNKVSYRLRLEIAASLDNLIKLWGRIGYEYNKEKDYLSNLALHYLRLKKRVINERQNVAQKILEAKKQGQKNADIFSRFKSKYINRRFIERSLWGKRKSVVRIAYNFPTFKEFCRNITTGLGSSGMVWDEIIFKQEIEKKPTYVYDFTVSNPYHNFIANSFVVSNCGVRLLTTGITFEQIQPHLQKLADELNRSIPSGVGSTGKIKLDRGSMDRVLAGGAKQVVSQGYGLADDLEHCESNGCLEKADVTKVSDHAKTRGRDQLGTLGSGNHFVEIQKVDQIFNEEVAKVFGLKRDEITILIHTGSRGLGHQVCTDWVRIFNQKMPQWGLRLPDRELACAPINSPEGQGYFGAMFAAANFAWANRQSITHLTRQTWQKVLPKELADKKLNLVYDVAHNIGKIEEYEIDGPNSAKATMGKQKMKLILHRKGATRAFPPNHPEIPKIYQSTGQPVLIPGSMGTASYVLAGTMAAKDSFWSVCHGAGRTMSRAAAKRKIWGADLIKELGRKGIIIKCGSTAGLAEEAPEAYKNVDHVVNIVAKAGLAQKVARLVPLAVIKGE